TKTEPFEEEPQQQTEHGRTSSYHPYRFHPNGTCFIFTSRKMVCSPYTLPPAIEAVIAESITAPPRKRTRSPSPSPSPPPPPVPRDTVVVATAKDSTLPPRNRIQMTSLHPVATAEVMVEATTPRKRLAARHWDW
ncbi:hypothetical protein Tco_0137580, partial [Tanacetum coccineum]